MSEDILHKKVLKVMEIATAEALPYIRDECKKLKISVPNIRFRDNITIKDKIIAGTYDYLTRTININKRLIWERIGFSFEAVMHHVMFIMFHEFKHHIDNELNLSPEGYRNEYDYWPNKEKYEREADEYAQKTLDKYLDTTWRTANKTAQHEHENQGETK